MTEKGARRAVWRVLLAIYLVLTGIVVAWPNAWAVNRAVVYVWQIGVTNGWYHPSGFSPEQFAVVLNVLLFIPPVLLAAASFPRVRVGWWVLAAGLGSCLVEFAQLIGGSRDATIVDIASNTGGALLGALIVAGWRRARGVGSRSTS